MDIIKDIYHLVNEKGIVVFEMGKESKYDETFNDLYLIKDKEYGIKRVVIYRREFSE